MNGDRKATESSNANSEAVAKTGSPRESKARFFDGVDRLSFGITTLAALSVYLWTLAPNVTLELSGIYCVGAMYAGVPHPPGYPLWTIYAWLFTVLLPVSNIAWRVGVSSAVAGALTCGITALMTSRGAGLIGEGLGCDLKAKQMAALRVVAGYLAGMALGFDGAFWRTAVVVNTWPFSLLLFSISLCFLMKWFFMPERKRSLYLACLTYGMTVNNSQALFVAALGLQMLIMLSQPAVGRDMLFGNCLLAAAVFLTEILALTSSLAVALALLSFALCVAAIVKTRSLLSEWRKTLVAGAMFFLGLAAYLYVPLASMTNPPVNWGYPRTVQGFFHVLTRGQYERIHPIDDLNRFFAAAGSYGKVALTDFGWMYLVMALIPFGFLHRLRREERRWILGLLAVYFCLALIMLVAMNPANDKQSVEYNKVFFSPSHMILAMFAGYGVVLLGTVVGRRTEPHSGQS